MNKLFLFVNISVKDTYILYILCASKDRRCGSVCVEVRKLQKQRKAFNQHGITAQITPNQTVAFSALQDTGKPRFACHASILYFS
jgi:hypothetical protein